MRKALFIHVVSSPVIEADKRFLEKLYTVESFFYRGGDLRQILKAQMGLLLWLLRHIWTSSLVFIWFADLHAFMPTFLARILGRKSVILVGGYDAARDKALGYGVHLSPVKSFIVKASCKLATRVFAVSKFTQGEINRFIGGKSGVLYNSINVRGGSAACSVPRVDVITVCGTKDVGTVIRKGVDFFAKVAREMPDVRFIAVGLEGEAREFLERGRSQNLTVWGRVPHEVICSLLREAKVACQFSRYEAFGLAIGEAMVMGCVPVGLNCGGTPEVIGDTGFLIDRLSVRDAVQAIERALNAPDALREKARRRVQTLFSQSLRETKLRMVLKEMGAI